MLYRLRGLFLVAIIFFDAIAIPQDTPKTKRAYTDTQNGYFMFLPPVGWKTENYSDPRTKVGFNHPNAAGVFIRFIVRQAPGETVEKMIEDDKRMAGQMKDKGLACEVKEMVWDGIKCSEIRAQIPNDAGTTMLRKFLTCGLHFNIQYSAPKKALYDQYLDEVTCSLDTITVLKGTGEDAAKAKDQQIAGRIRLAKLTTELGFEEEAVQILKEAQIAFPESDVIQNALNNFRQKSQDKPRTEKESVEQIDKLILAVQKGDGEQKVAAISALAKMGKKGWPAIDALVQALSDNTQIEVQLSGEPAVTTDSGFVVRSSKSVWGFRTINEEALVALKQITGQMIGLDQAAWKDWLRKEKDKTNESGQQVPPQISVPDALQTETQKKYSSSVNTRWKGSEYAVRVATVNIPTVKGFRMTYWETEPEGICIAGISELDSLIGKDLVIEQTPDSSLKDIPIAATMEPLEENAFKVTAGSEGMHLGLDLMTGDSNLGSGLICDVKYLGKRVVFKPGTVQGKEAWFTFTEGACITAKDGTLIGHGIIRSHQNPSTDRSRIEIPTTPTPPCIPDKADAPSRRETQETSPSLGMTILSVEETLSRQLNLPSGVGLVVNHVEPDGPAAGKVQIHDILHKMNDQILINESQFKVLQKIYRADKTVMFTVIRQGKPITLVIDWMDNQPVKSQRRTTEIPDSKTTPPRFSMNEDQLDTILSALQLPKGQWTNSTGTYSSSMSKGNEKFTIASDEKNVKTFTVHGKDGKVLYKGPVNTQEEIDGIPDRYKESFAELKKNAGVSFPKSG